MFAASSRAGMITDTSGAPAGGSALSSLSDRDCAARQTATAGTTIHGSDSASPPRRS